MLIVLYNRLLTVNIAVKVLLIVSIVALVTFTLIRIMHIGSVTHHKFPFTTIIFVLVVELIFQMI